MSRVLVLGAAGMLGHKVCQRLSGHEVTGLVRQATSVYEGNSEIFGGVSLLGGVDVLEGGRLEEAISDLKPQAVVNCVGLVKQIEEAADPYLAVAINALLPHHLARLCAKIDARLIHVSTDCVFDGRRGSYLESDVPNAADLYGRSKALGETTGREQAAMTLRTSFIGRELKPAKHGLVEWFLSNDGAKVNGFANVTYSGLSSIELADVIRLVIESRQNLCGIYHVAGASISKYELLRLIRRIYSLDIEIARAEEPVCDRSLVMSSFSTATGYRAPTWSDMIHQMHRDPTPYDVRMSRREDTP